MAVAEEVSAGSEEGVRARAGCSGVAREAVAPAEEVTVLVGVA